MDGAIAIAVEAQKQKEKLVSVLSEKVCFVSYIVSKHDDRYSNGCHIFVIDLSELVDGSMGVLEPNIILEQFGFGDSVCGVDSTLYFTPFSFETRKFYALDIQTHQSKKQQKLNASHLRSLPLMLGRKSSALLTPIPATKKILVFSSLCTVHCWDPDRVPSRHPPPARDDDADDDDDEDDRFVDFEMYDIETNSWEKLPDLIIRMQPILPGGTRSYFWHESFTDKRGIPISSYDERFRISRYTFIDNDTVFLVQLNCGVKFTLNLNSPSKSWKLYNEGGMLFKPCTSHQNHLFLVEEGLGKKSWCASHIGGDLTKFGNVVSFPLSSFCQDEQVKQHKTFSTLIPLEGDKGEGGYVCIVQGGVSLKSRHGLVIMDVMDAKAKNQPQLVASCRFEVMHHYKTFWPCRLFVYHSN